MSFYYIIPTTQKYKDISLSKFLPSLKTEHKIIIAINNCDKTELISNQIDYYYTTNNAFEYLAPITAIELLKPEDRFFWLHDTCEAGPQFDTIITSVINNETYSDFDYIDIYNGYCNFGIYTVEFMLRDKDWLYSQRNITKDQAVKNEMRYWEKYATHLSNKTRRFPQRLPLEYQQIGYEDVYNTGHIRVIEYYGSIDLYKFKLNCASQSGQYRTVI